MEEKYLRIQAENLREVAEEKASEEAQRRIELEEELEQLRIQLADAKKEYK